MSQIFISYSHQDEKWKDQLAKDLNVLQLEGQLTYSFGWGVPIY